MTLNDFTAKYDAQIAQIAKVVNEVNPEAGCDLGMARSIFLNAARLGYVTKVPDNEVEVVAAQYACGDNDWWAKVKEEYLLCEDE